MEKVSRHFIIITDLEPDDWMALIIAATMIPVKEVLFIGTTVLHAGRRKVLAENIVKQLNYSVPIIQGSGGNPSDYEDIASSRAAREYTHEDDKFQEAHPSINRSSHDLKNAILLALQKYNDIEFVVLAPPTDLAVVLQENPSLRSNIKHIHIMGGWINVNNINYTTYNWNMDPICSASLVEMADIPMTIFSSHLIKAAFQGGSINRANFPKLIYRLDELIAKVPILKDQRIASTDWNKHLAQKIPVLANIIGPYIDHQFTPADPIVIMSLIYPELVIQKKPISIKIDLTVKDPTRGYKVEVYDNPGSRINVVESLDVSKFIDGFYEVLKSFG